MSTSDSDSSSQSPTHTSLNTDPPSTSYDPLHSSNCTITSQPTKNIRVLQPRHCHLPMWLPPNESADTSTNTTNKMLIIHPKNTFLKDEQAQDNVYNSSLNNNNAWKCVECLTVFYMKNRLQLHYVLEHGVGYCHLCDLFMDGEAEGVAHRGKIHEGKTCDFCYVLVSDADLSEHHRLAHDVLSCPFCLAYIRPSSELAGHITNTHRLKVPADDPDVPKLFKQCSGESFQCFLCAEHRKRELVGHLNIYHKVHNHILADIFRKYKVNLSLVIEGASEKGPLKNVTCEICREKIPKVVPTEFHFIYCNHKLCCTHCNMIFQSPDALHSHNNLLHERHPCKLNCSNLAYNSAENLTKHYLAYHKIELCTFCDKMIDMATVDGSEVAISGLRKHAKIAHASTGKGGDNRDATLLELIEGDDNQRHLNCCLCNDVIPSSSANEVYLHFIQEHNVVGHRILTLIGGNLLTMTVVEEDIDVDNNDVVSIVGKDKEDVLKEINDITFAHIFDEQFVECLFDVNEIINDFDIKCELCPEEFESALQYIAHLFTFHNFNIPKRFMDCAECGFQKNRSTAIFVQHLQHFKDPDNSPKHDKKFTCNLCYADISLFEAYDHYKKQHNKQKDKKSLKKHGYKCRFCKQVFWNAQRKDSHENQMHFDSNIDKFYSCQMCDQPFTTPSLLRSHKADCNTPYEAPVLYHCLKCSLVLASAADCTRHFEEHHEDSLRYRCVHEECRGSFKDRRIVKRHYYSVHFMKKEKKVFLCNICGQSFLTKNSLGGHKHVHTMQKRLFKCTVCPEKFITKSIRNHHVQSMHLGENRFRCPDCDEMFQSRTALSMHRTSHRGQLICTYCQKEFSRRDSYKEHLLIHEGPRHQCPHCPRAFTQISNLKRHLRIHTGEKPYKCVFCDKTFSDVGACKSHTSIHTREQECECNVCGKKYSKKQKLKYHMKTHTGEDMHPCHICHKNFVGRYALRVHLTCHENGGQAAIFVCDLCSKECKTKGSLSIHRKRCKGVPLVPKRKYNVKSKDPLVKRQYIKKKRTLNNLNDNENSQNASVSIENVSQSVNDNLENVKNIQIDLEMDDIVDDPSKDLIDMSDIMVATNDSSSNMADKNTISEEFVDEDNISIKKLKSAIINKIKRTKELIYKPNKLKETREEYLPNKDILNTDVLSKLTSSINCADASLKVIKQEQLIDEKDMLESDANMQEVQFVNIKLEPKEEHFD